MLKNNDNVKSKSILKHFNKAFTIVELLIVIVIIGILAAITIVSYTGITKKAGESSVQAELSNASKKLALYYTLNGTYPTNIDQSTGCPTAPVTDTQNCIKFGSGTTFSYNFKTASTYGLSANKGSVGYIITESSGPVAFVPSFVKTWGGTSSDFANDLTQTGDGGYIVTGLTYSFGAGSNDTFLAKYDASGNLSWNKTWGGASQDSGNDIAQTSDGGYVVTGQAGSYGAGSYDMFLAKYDASGNLIWNKLWGGADTDIGYNLAQTSDGGYVVTGQTSSYGAGFSDMFLAKYDANGNLIWNKLWGGASVESGQGLIQTSDGGYAVVGYTLSYGAGNYDMFLAKYDASGNLSWNKTWGGSSDDRGHKIVQASDGGYILAGYCVSYGNAGSSDVLLVKYDVNGNLIWNKMSGGYNNDVGYALTKTSDGGYAITGLTNSFGAGNNDIFLNKYDASGNLIWNKTLGGTGSDMGQSLTQTSDGGYIITGYTSSYGVDNNDMFLAKYDASGNINNCSSSMCKSPTVPVITPTATITIPSATITTPTANIATPTVTVTTPTATQTTVVAP